MTPHHHPFNPSHRARGTSSAGARAYYSDDEAATMGEGGMGSDDGEVLSVSAYVSVTRGAKVDGSLPNSHINILLALLAGIQ
jgi:hypothetical protein